VTEAIKTATKELNKLWGGSHLACHVKFGWKDDKKGGTKFPIALNGPAIKDVLRHGSLLIQSLKIMKPVYQLFEAKQYHVENEDGEWSLNKPAVDKSKGKRKAAGQPAGAKKAPKKKVAKGRSLHSLCKKKLATKTATKTMMSSMSLDVLL